MDFNGPVEAEYRVVVNHEEQYSIWPSYKQIPRGWRDVGVIGSKTHCLQHIETVWTDITPRSVREAIAKRRSAS